MLNIEADLHTHTVASGHAYSTVDELARTASQKGLKLIAITDHGPKMPGATSLYYFGNLKIVPEELYGVKVITGVEANILDNGKVDLPDYRLRKLDFVAAGIHNDVGYNNNDFKHNTRATIRAIENEYVKMITHPANFSQPLNLKKVVKAAAANKVILEINASSFDRYREGRRGNKETTVKLIELARGYGAEISLNSDAHFHTDVGNISHLEEVISETGLREEEIINGSFTRLIKYLKMDE